VRKEKRKKRKKIGEQISGVDWRGWSVPVL
jgi:hypothetical protein